MEHSQHYSIQQEGKIHPSFSQSESNSLLLGQKIVARAWIDDEYKQRLLANAKAVIAELGIEMAAQEFICVENTDKIHNIVVCTLCSCYPEEVLGASPLWYRSLSYRSRVIREPRTVLREFGTEIPEHIKIQVHDSTFERRYLVLPHRPEGAEKMNEEDLALLVTRDSMIGVALAR
ncbi:nitrile hydratase alpha subunit [Tolypothrix sp. NIES-4075]|uniref:nitrile hydratase subunit alpha n=1 Tax=Tolypothrix sp. NIES-4075 TaxID=2005459 RepID=UPI000B5C5715|nr:nitrile hydratase subunit alpha [Tolypothrix sp. NIES-4075]GAX43012.1 nitrile hydratase alpha subunit [Tolypothrix sp. NIES-4075]